MTQAYLGQIMFTPYTFAPKGWAQCNGQLLPISQNSALFSLLGTYYGGNGTTNFALPDLRSRTPIGMGSSSSGATYNIGQFDGTESVTLQSSQIPQHTHTAGYSTGDATARNPTHGLFGKTGNNSIYAPASGTPQVPLNSTTIGLAGGNQPHSNLQPYLVLNFCVALNGIYPSRG